MRSNAEALLELVPHADPRPQNFPDELAALPQWVAWGAKQANGKATKPPFNPNADGLQYASPTDPKTWGTLEEALSFLSAHRGEVLETKNDTVAVAGVGFCLTGDTGITGIDLDHAINADGSLQEWAVPLVNAMKAAAMYIEISPSGTGFRAFCKEPLPPEYCGQGFKLGDIEVYAKDRYLTLTGHRLEGSGSVLPKGQACSSALSSLWKHAHPAKTAPKPQPSLFQTPPPRTQRTWSDDEILQKAFASQNGADLESLFTTAPSNAEDKSAMDLALANLLAFWSMGDPDRLDRMMRQSARLRDAERLAKWDKKHSARGETYGEMTVSKAMEACRQFFAPYYTPTPSTLASTKKKREAQGVPQPVSHPQPEPLTFITRAEARKMPVAGQMVAGLMPDCGLGQVYGDSGCGKSFTLMMLTHCISEGWQFCGRAVKRRPVYYFHLEGVGGLPKRLAAFDAWMEETDRKFDGQGRLFYRTADFSITEESMSRLAEAINGNGDAGALVVIDTQAQATAGMDENAAQDMSLVLKNARSLAKAIGGVVLLVHHTGKDLSKGGRGSSVQRADFDFQIEAAKDKSNDRLVIWNSTKERDDDDKQQIQFFLKVYEKVLQDVDGKWQSSCVAVPFNTLSIEEQAELTEGRKKKEKVPSGLAIAMQALEEAIYEEQQENQRATGVTEAQFRKVFYRRYPDSSEDPEKAKEAKKKAFSRYKADLLAQGRAVHDDGIWRLYRPTVNGEVVPASKPEG